MSLPSRELNIALIQDDSARGRAQIADEEQQLRERLNLWGVDAAERRRIDDDDLAQWRLLRERQPAAR